jgi:hypothetical protein
MEMQEIEVIIAKDGNLELRVSGVKGTACLDLTKALEGALGGQVISREMTPEAQEMLQAEDQTNDRLSLRGTQ